MINPVQLQAPDWWYPDAAHSSLRVMPWLLSPVTAVYAAVASWRLRRGARYVPALPVICVGNFTAGGTGKTPLAIYVAKQVQARGLRPVFLTKGYGGQIIGPYTVDLHRDDATRVGDEPLLLARTAPVVISRDRALGARQIERMDADVIIMDDGMQNPSIQKTLTLAVVDGTRGFGNGWTIPSGPLRAPLDRQIQLADAIVMNDGGSAEASGVFAPPPQFTGAVLRGGLVAVSARAQLLEKDVVACSGIGNPARFHKTLEQCGARIVSRHSFGDHHIFSDAEAETILGDADRRGAMIVTTEKDLVRLPTSGNDRPLTRLRERCYALPVAFTFQDADGGRFEALLDMAINKRDDWNSIGR